MDANEHLRHVLDKERERKGEASVCNVRKKRKVHFDHKLHAVYRKYGLICIQMEFNFI